VKFPVGRPKVAGQALDGDELTFLDLEGQAHPGETSIGLTKRAVRQVHADAPHAIPGRTKKAMMHRAADSDPKPR
jgi:hypothetical protein